MEQASIKYASGVELTSFVTKYRYLCSAGFQAHLSFSCQNGRTHVSLNVDLGILQPPVEQPPPTATLSKSSKCRSPSYSRRLQRRRHERESANSPYVDTEKVITTEAEEVPVRKEVAEFIKGEVTEKVVESTVSNVSEKEVNTDVSNTNGSLVKEFCNGQIIRDEKYVGVMKSDMAHTLNGQDCVKNGASLRMSQNFGQFPI